MPELTARESDIQGLGVFAERRFDAEEVVLVLDPSRVVDEEHPLRPEVGEYEEHCTYLRDGRVVLLKSPERHLNHSCDPNSYMRTQGTELQVVARRPIEPGQEVTLDYLINTHGGSRWRCHCGAERCRGLLEESFFDMPLELQQEYLPLLEDWFAEQHAEAVGQLEAQSR